MVTVALSPAAVVQVTACRPGVGSTANGSEPTLSPAGCPSTNHQSREPDWLPATWHTILWRIPPGTTLNTAPSSGLEMASADPARGLSFTFPSKSR